MTNSLYRQPRTVAVLTVLTFLVSLVNDSSFSDPFFVAKNYYFLIFVFPLIIIYVFGSIKQRYSQVWEINLLDIFVITYFLYSLVRAVNFSSISFLSQEIIVSFFLLFFYLIIKDFTTQFNESDREKFFIVIFLGAILLLFCNTIWGILQLIDTERNTKALFILVGSFGNSGPYAIYLVSLLPFVGGVILFKKLFSSTLYRLSIGILIISILVISFSLSRTAWISFLFGLIFLLWSSPNRLNCFFYRVMHSYRWSKLIGLLILFLLSYLIFFYLIRFKQDSASGRLLIWKLSAEGFFEKPFWGHGYNSFTHTLNALQARFFSSVSAGQETFSRLADNATFAFNEYLQVGLELGLIGFILLVGIFLFSLSSKLKPFSGKGNKISYVMFFVSKAIVVVVMVSSFFSYPLHILPIKILFIFSLIIISSYKRSKIQFRFVLSVGLKKLFLSLVFSIGLFLGYFSSQRFFAERKWKLLQSVNRKLPIQTMKARYLDLLPVLSYNEYFLFNYGSELIVAGDYERGVRVLESLLGRLNDSNVYTYIGYGYFQMGEYKNAQQNFKNAILLVPSKIFPTYYLVKLYNKTDRHQDAFSLAKEILEIGEKTPTSVGRSILLEMHELIDKFKLE